MSYGTVEHLQEEHLEALYLFCSHYVAVQTALATTRRNVKHLQSLKGKHPFHTAGCNPVCCVHRRALCLLVQCLSVLTYVVHQQKGINQAPSKLPCTAYRTRQFILA